MHESQFKKKVDVSQCEMLVKKKLMHVVVLTVFPAFSGVFELNFMSEQPASGYYQFTVAVTGDSRLVANHVEASFHHELVFTLMMSPSQFDLTEQVVLC